MIGALVIRDARAAAAQQMYAGAVRGLQRIAELQYDAQETRRAAFYALTASESNLQAKYAGQSRFAGQKVNNNIAEFDRQAKMPAEAALAKRLGGDWATYLASRDEVLAVLESSTQEAVNRDLSKGVPAFERVRQDLDQIQRLYDREASQRLVGLVAFSRRSALRLTGILFFTLLLSVSAVWVSQRNKMLDAIRSAKLQMEFVACVSHELRAPLAVLRSAADNLADGVIRDEAALRRYSSIFQRQSRNMSDLVDRILLFASTEDGKRHYELGPLEVGPVIDEALAGTQTLVRDAGFLIESCVDSGLPPVDGDHMAVAQCLQNLIGNAVKYGGADRRVVLRAFAVPAGGGRGQEVRISVTDHGIGIEAQELPHIFEPFYRSPRVRAAQIHGTGLGLSLASRIAQSMGGSLTVTSELALGSTFTLHLCAAKAEERPPAMSTPLTAPEMMP